MDLVGKIKIFNSHEEKSRMFIIAGGMTSTPALGVLVKKGNGNEDISQSGFQTVEKRGRLCYNIMELWRY